MTLAVTANNKNTPENLLCITNSKTNTRIVSLNIEFSFAPRLMMSLGNIVKCENKSTIEVNQYFSEVLTQFLVSGISEDVMIKRHNDNKTRNPSDLAENSRN